MLTVDRNMKTDVNKTAAVTERNCAKTGKQEINVCEKLVPIEIVYRYGNSLELIRVSFTFWLVFGSKCLLRTNARTRTNVRTNLRIWSDISSLLRLSLAISHEH